MECVWQLTAYTYPESISLPQDYQPPNMAITASYWKAWQMLLIMTAYNPEDFGTAGWKSYPTLRALMEMCITNQVINREDIISYKIHTFCLVFVSAPYSQPGAGGRDEGPGAAGDEYDDGDDKLL